MEIVTCEPYTLVQDGGDFHTVVTLAARHRHDRAVGIRYLANFRPDRESDHARVAANPLQDQLSRKKAAAVTANNETNPSKIVPGFNRTLFSEMKRDETARRAGMTSPLIYVGPHV